MSIRNDKLCKFCGFFGSEGTHEYVDTPWLQNNLYSAIVSKGALVPGWTLVSPNIHRMNLSELYSEESFWHFVAEAADVIAKQYGEVTLFEHGPTKRGSAIGCGTDHAHLHLVPLRFDLISEVINSNKDMVWVPCSSSEVQAVTSGKEYLFISSSLNGKDTTGRLHIVSDPTSQFFRRIIAQRLGIPDKYNYREYPMLELAKETATRLNSQNMTKEFISA